MVYEVLVTSVIPTKNQVTINFSTWFVQGIASIFKAIKTEVEWAPQHFGTPQDTKQINEGTILFDQNNIYGASVSYASDRSADFTEIFFKLKGPGFWSSFVWGNATFGGAGNDVPLRTLVPQNKSRCRYLTVRFKHVNSRESYRIVGISLEPRLVGPRGYR